MTAGLAVCIYYMMRTYPFFTNMGVPKMDLWFGLNSVSAGMFGLPVGLLTIIVVSLLTAPPPKEVQELVEHVRYPNLTGDTLVSEAR
jgi:cation/acetate symporter